MRAKGIRITAEILSVVLSVCADSVAFEKGQMIHGCVLKGGFEDYVTVRNSLIRIYGKQESGLCDEAFEIFSQLKNSGGSLMLQPDVQEFGFVVLESEPVLVLDIWLADEEQDQARPCCIQSDIGGRV
ncbi:hypothetical protein RJ641_023980 [Dillenia turbinata]|uniref:Uncharacterized protein n=1 Tax=Dillenia turbinata TaxID=194707 RepID=A0AAN8UJY1_9MAGN